MTSLVKFFSFICVFITLFTYCICRTVKNIEFIKYNDTESEFNGLSCARLLKSGNVCGCKMDVHSKMYTSLLQAPWCSDRVMQSDYVYMETESMRSSPSMKWDGNKWLFTGGIPVCMTPGAVIEINFTTRVDWTTIAINLYNKDADRPMTMRIRHQQANVKFFTHMYTNGTMVNKEDGDPFPFVADETYILQIEVLEYSYKVYLNETLYHEYSVTVTDIIPVNMVISMYNVVSDLQYVEYRKGGHP